MPLVINNFENPVATITSSVIETELFIDYATPFPF